MESTRQLKVARLVQKELSDIILREESHLTERALVTVTTVRISPDLSHAKVYLSIFAHPDRLKLLGQIKQHHAELRHKLGLRVRNQLRIVPDLSFFLDDSVDYALRIEELLKK